MTKIMVADGVVECPECGDQLQALYLVKTIAYIRWNEKEECWERGLKSHEEDATVLVEIFCPSCSFDLAGDAIHTVDVEVWRFYEQEKAEHDWRKFDEWQQRQQNGE